jgi:hypothetical protein
MSGVKILTAIQREKRKKKGRKKSGINPDSEFF